MPDYVAYVVVIDHGGYEGWAKPDAVCATRAAALAYIGAHANDGRGGKWEILVMPVLTVESVAAEASDASGRE